MAFFLASIGDPLAMKRNLLTRPEILEFRNKWNKEITAEDLEAFVKWVVEYVQKPNESLAPYDAVFAGIALAVAPFYKTDKNVRDYIDMLANTGHIMKFIAKGIINENSSSGTQPETLVASEWEESAKRMIDIAKRVRTIKVVAIVEGSER